jgi:hypothetical protein
MEPTPRDSIAVMATTGPCSEADTRICLSKPIHIFFNLFVIFIATLWWPDWQTPWKIIPGAVIKVIFPAVLNGNGFIKIS